MRASRKQRTNSDFLIIGGGMAGIAALAEARRQGINAICLEAAGKLGGRIRTARNRRVAPYPIELGAEFVHGPLMRQLCESLGLTLIKHPSDGVVFADKGFLPLLPLLEVLAAKSLRMSCSRRCPVTAGGRSRYRCACAARNSSTERSSSPEAR